MHPGCFRYISGTNIEVGICCIAQNIRSNYKDNLVVWASVRKGKRYTPFLKKNKNNEILPGDHKRLVRQDIPAQLLKETSDFTLKGKPKYTMHDFTDENPKEIILNELQWTTKDIHDTCYSKETYYTMKNGKHITLRRYDRKPRSWEYIKHARFLFIHGLRQLAYPIASVKDNIVTFNTKPTIKAHVGVCRLIPTKTHLFCNNNRSYDPYITIGQGWFNFGYVKDTSIHVSVLWEQPPKKPTFVLCYIRTRPLKELIWLPTSIITHKHKLLEELDGNVRKVFIHGRIPVFAAGKYIGFTPATKHGAAELHTMQNTRIQDTPEQTRIKKCIMENIRTRHKKLKAQAFW